MIFSTPGGIMNPRLLHIDSPLSLAIAIIGNASTHHLSGAVSPYSSHQQQLRLTNPESGDTAELHIARAAQAASRFHVSIIQVTTLAMHRQVTRILRAFVRETQAPMHIILASQAA
jgi:hypothetical protein